METPLCSPGGIGNIILGEGLRSLMASSTVCVTVYVCQKLGIRLNRYEVEELMDFLQSNIDNQSSAIDYQ